MFDKCQFPQSVTPKTKKGSHRPQAPAEGKNKGHNWQLKMHESHITHIGCNTTLTYLCLKVINLSLYSLVLNCTVPQLRPDIKKVLTTSPHFWTSSSYSCLSMSVGIAPTKSLHLSSWFIMKYPWKLWTSDATAGGVGQVCELKMRTI